MRQGAAQTKNKAPALPKGDQDVWLTPDELAKRWEGRIKPKTLSNWRHIDGKGPLFRRIGGRILYRLDWVKDHELKNGFFTSYSSTKQYGKGERFDQS